jgi:hypothetical protein
MNQKNFSIINRISKSLSLYITDFPYVITLLFRISDRMVLTFTPIVAMIFSSTIIIKRVRLTISSVKFTEKPVATIKGGIVRLAYTIKESLKITYALEILGQIIDFGMSLIQKANTTIVQQMPLSATMLLASFNTLGMFEVIDLGTLDSETLGDMDYTVV